MLPIVPEINLKNNKLLLNLGSSHPQKIDSEKIENKNKIAENDA